MSQPTPYTRQFDFTGHSASRPNTPLPGVQVDAELNAVRAALNHALTNLALIQRDDTGLANGVVGIDQLSAIVQAMLAGGGFTVRGNWAAATAYLRGDVVSDSGKVYLVITDHNSSASLAADIASGYVSSALFEPHALLDYMDDLAASTGAGLVGSTGGITVQAALDLKAALASPTFTGTPAAPTAALGTDTTQIATTAFVQAAVQALLDAAPGTLDTLNELAAALGDDANFASTMTTALAAKAASADLAASGGAALIGTADFDGTTIPDDSTAQEALQALETAVELRGFTIETYADIATTTIPAIVDSFYLQGYATAGDGGGAQYKRAASEPSHEGKAQSADTAWWEIADATIKPKMLGAKGDATEGSDGAITATDATFTSAAAAFTSSDIGKRISIAGAGTAGAVHSTTIASINSATSVELTLAAVTTVSGAVYVYGSDDTTAITNAIGVARNIDFDWGDYLVSSKITVANAGQRFFASGYPRVTGVDIRCARIVVDNPTLDYVFHCTQTNNTFQGFRISTVHTTTAEAFLFERAAGSASDIDARLIDMSIEGITNAATVVGRGLHVKRCEFGNLTRGIALDWPTDWTPNGQSNDLEETGARSYMIEDCLFHGTATWVTNTGANAQNVRAVTMCGNLGDIGGTMFSGVLIESVIDASVSNINAVSAGVIDLDAGSRNSTITGVRHGGIIEGAADRTSNNCLNIETTTTNTTRDITVIGCSFGPCERNAIQIFGGGEALGIKFIGCSIDRPAQTTGGSYTPIAIFNSGGTLTKVEASFIGCSIDMSGTDSTVVIGGTNSGVIEVHWIGNQVRNFPTAPLAIAQSAVNVFQEGGEVNPKYTQFARKNGTWATDRTEWLYRMEAKTMDVSGGGVGIAGSVALYPATSLASSTYWRWSVSDTSTRDVGVIDIVSGGIVPISDNTKSLGSSSLRFSESYVVLRRWTSTVFDSAGSGTPEGAVTAGIGSTFRRTDGGAVTSFYVKESGTGNTGWVAK